MILSTAVDLLLLGFGVLCLRVGFDVGCEAVQDWHRRQRRRLPRARARFRGPRD